LYRLPRSRTQRGLFKLIWIQNEFTGRGLFKLIWIQNKFTGRGRLRGQRNRFCIQSPYVCARVRVRVRVHTCRGGGAGHVTLERAGHVTLEKELESVLYMLKYMAICYNHEDR